VGTASREIKVHKIREHKHNGSTWLDVGSSEPKVFDRLKNEFHLHPIHLNESTQKVQHNQVEREDDYLFFVLHFPLFDSSSHKIIIGQVGIFLGKDFLVTIHEMDCPTIDKLFDEWTEIGDKISEGSDRLLYELIHRLLGNIADMIDYVQSELDAIEDVVFNDDNSEAMQISKVRQKIVRLSRVIEPKRLILEDLAQQIDGFMGRKISRYYANNTKMANRLWEVIEEAKETVEIFKDADFTISTEKTNKTLMLLTLVFTFTIPITVISTLYGMNVLLPGGIEAGSWMFLGRYTSFVVLVVFSLLVTLGMHFYFRKKKWF
jgi:magnesium transporter